MKIDGLDWMDWLHKVRREAEEKRIRDGLSVEEWLQRVRTRADKGRAERHSLDRTPVVHDKPRSDS